MAAKWPALARLKRLISMINSFFLRLFLPRLFFHVHYQHLQILCKVGLIPFFRSFYNQNVLLAHFVILSHRFTLANFRSSRTTITAHCKKLYDTYSIKQYDAVNSTVSLYYRLCILTANKNFSAKKKCFTLKTGFETDLVPKSFI